MNPRGRARIAAALAIASAFGLAAVPAQGSEGAAETAVELPPGTELRTAPAWEAPVVAVSAGGSAEPAGEPFGDWIEVRHGETTAWVRLDDPSSWPAGGPAALARARRQLGAAAAVERRLGPFAAASDLPDDKLWRALDRLAGAAVQLWSERYGLDPRGLDPRGLDSAGTGAGDPAAAPPEAPPETVVVFGREEDYRAAAPAGGADLAGHATAGFTLLWAGERSIAEIGGTLVHELTHLLNRRAFGYAPPAWLDEGTAEDLALARPDSRGRLTSAPLSRRSIHAGHRIEIYGPLLALAALLAALDAGELPPLPDMLALDRETLLASPDRHRLYAYNGFWIRYLIEGDNGDLREPFRAFLAAAAAGGAPSPDALAETLGRDWPELEDGYHGWLRGLPRRLGLPPQGRR